MTLIITKVTFRLQNMFKLKVLGNLKYFLGLVNAKSFEGIYMRQRKCTLELLEDIGFLNAKLAKISMDLGLQFNPDITDHLPDPFMNRRLLGRLMYLTISRPDIYYLCHQQIEPIHGCPKKPSSSGQCIKSFST